MAMQPINGKKYTRLVALSPVPGNPYRWVFRCDCGTVKQVRSYSVLTGSVKSCGCLNRENIGNVRKTHGATGTSLHKVFGGMHGRCSPNNNHPRNIKNYAERGIKVCDEWKDYVVFEKWALANGYKKGLQLDRINNFMGYSPENCRWVTSRQNSQNRRNSWRVETEYGLLTMPEAMAKLNKTRQRILREFEGKVFRLGDLQNREVL